MAKLARVRFTRSARLEASSHQRPPAGRHNYSSVPTQGSLNVLLTPPDFFIHSLHAAERGADLDISLLGPGANVQVHLKVYVEIDFETYYATFATGPAHTLVVRVETPLPTGGNHTARLASWERNTREAPLWLTSVSARRTSPLCFTRSLGWLYAVVSAIETRPSRNEGDVWCRFLCFINNVKEAYRRAPTQALNSSETRPRPRPRPRARRVDLDLDNAVDAFSLLRVTDEEGCN